MPSDSALVGALALPVLPINKMKKTLQQSTSLPLCMSWGATKSIKLLQSHNCERSLEGRAGLARNAPNKNFSAKRWHNIAVANAKPHHSREKNRINLVELC